LVKSQPPKQRNHFNLTNRNEEEKRNGEEVKRSREKKMNQMGGGEGGFIWQFFRRKLIVVGGIKFHRKLIELRTKKSSKILPNFSIRRYSCRRTRVTHACALGSA